MKRLFYTVLMLTASLSAMNVLAEDMVVMSFNLKGDGAGLTEVWDARRSWSYVFGRGRRERAVDVIRAATPDVLGVQELKANQRDDLLRAFPEFDYYGRGRGDKENDQNGIFYRKARFERTREGDFWLSPTPDTPNTVFAGSGTDVDNPRMATWIQLRDKAAGSELFVLCTHWSLDAAARLESARLMREKIAMLRDGLPSIVLGDFNATEQEASYITLLGAGESQGFQFADSYRVVTPAIGHDERTYHAWGKYGTRGSRIDYIFYSADTFKAEEADIVRTSEDGDKFPSDHFPVTARLTVLSK